MWAVGSVSSRAPGTLRREVPHCVIRLGIVQLTGDDQERHVQVVEARIGGRIERLRNGRLFVGPIVGGDPLHDHRADVRVDAIMRLTRAIDPVRGFELGEPIPVLGCLPTPRPHPSRRSTWTVIRNPRHRQRPPSATGCESDTRARSRARCGHRGTDRRRGPTLRPSRRARRPRRRGWRTRRARTPFDRIHGVEADHSIAPTQRRRLSVPHPQVGHAGMDEQHRLPLSLGLVVDPCTRRLAVAAHRTCHPSNSAGRECRPVRDVPPLTPPGPPTRLPARDPIAAEPWGSHEQAGRSGHLSGRGNRRHRRPHPQGVGLCRRRREGEDDRRPGPG